MWNSTERYGTYFGGVYVGGGEGGGLLCLWVGLVVERRDDGRCAFPIVVLIFPHTQLFRETFLIFKL